MNNNNNGGGGIVNNNNNNGGGEFLNDFVGTHILMALNVPLGPFVIVFVLCMRLCQQCFGCSQGPTTTTITTTLEAVPSQTTTTMGSR